MNGSGRLKVTDSRVEGVDIFIGNIFIITSGERTACGVIIPQHGEIIHCIIIYESLFQMTSSNMSVHVL